MTTRYRVEYALKTHRRDQFIEWIKGLLAVPFVLHSQPTAADSEQRDALAAMVSTSHRRYAEILQDVEGLIDDHIKHQSRQSPSKSKLAHLVPTIGNFFTPLPLHDAFRYQDARRRISSRRFVAPSFNDVRQILNTAQLLSVAHDLSLVTFDGDVTLYADGESLGKTDAVITRLLRLLKRGVSIAIVTAAGYTDAKHYHTRLMGLLDQMAYAETIGDLKEPTLLVMGGECNYLFKYDSSAPYKLRYIERRDWLLPTMKSWTEKDIVKLLDVAESALKSCIDTLSLSASTYRKDRAVGIIPSSSPTTNAMPLTREQLEETVLVTQQILENTLPSLGITIPFCAFNGGSDVFVDIGDKSWGVQACQTFLGGIPGRKTLHVGDQFLSAGSNDFKARSACTTAWIASPAETVHLLDELDEHCGSMAASV